jgi:16S rRNA processing protein RimM
MKSDDRLTVATIGKVVGLGGDLKLHSETDFIEQFCAGEKFFLANGDEISVANFDGRKNLIKFEGFLSREEAKKLTNQKLYTTKSKSKNSIELKDGEYFWFDLENLEVYEDNTLIGTIIKVERIAGYDYLLLSASKQLTASCKGPKSFLIPYIRDRYIKQVDLKSKRVDVVDAVELYKAS